MNNNDHIFSEKYTEKKAEILGCIEKSQVSAPAVRRSFPMKAVIAVAIVCVVLTTSVLAAGVIGKHMYKFKADYLPEGVEEIVGAEERFDVEGFPSLEYYVVDLEGETFTHVDELPPEQREGIEYEIFSVNGHYAQIIHYTNWIPEEDFDEFTNKQLIVHFEEEDLLVQVWATNLISMEELKKVAEGLSFEPTEDGSLAVKVYQCD